jgi:hypothetical protein
VLGAKVIICKPADPEAKGGIERLHDYLERSFLSGRSFGSPADFNSQLQAWPQLANRRRKRSLGCAPADRIAADKAGLNVAQHRQRTLRPSFQLTLSHR